MSITELSGYLTIETRLDVKSLALQQVLGLTGSKEGRLLLMHCPKLCHHLGLLMNDQQSSVATDASLALVNLSADEDIIPLIINTYNEVIDVMLQAVLNSEHDLADPACMVLSNITRIPMGSQQVFEKMTPNLDKFIDIFCHQKFNKKGAKLHYMAAVLSNLSQIPDMRKYVMNPSKPILQRLASFTQYQDSIIRRGGIVGLIKNCCFQTENHDWLLGESVDLLPKLLIPLAGPEEYSEEENDKLPIELQYLGNEKRREEDSDIRKMLLEALTQLCATKTGREFLRSKNTYVILRELHKWEKNASVLAVCEHLVNILIRYEHEIGHDNLNELEVPADLTKIFDGVE